MKKSQVKVGKFYAAKVSDRMTTIRIDRENPRGGWDATNLRTGKTVRIKSAQRLRHETRGPGKRQEAVKAVHKADQENARLAEERAKSADGQTASERAMAESEPAARKGRKSSKAGGGKRRGRKSDVAKTVDAVEKGNLAEGIVVPDGKKSGKAEGQKRPSGLDAAAQVLADADEPLNTKEMVARMLAKGLWRTGGKTPAATIYAAIIREIRTKGDDARFRKVERGKFALAGS